MRRKRLITMLAANNTVRGSKAKPNALTVVLKLCALIVIAGCLV